MLSTKNDKEEIAFKKDISDNSTKDIDIGDEASDSSIQEDDNLDRSMKRGIKHNLSNNGSSSLQQEQPVAVPRRSSRRLARTY